MRNLLRNSKRHLKLMAKIRSNLIFNNFSSGQLGSGTFERFDLKRYLTGLAELKNRLPMIKGGTTSRPPFKFVAEVKSGKNGTSHALIPFSFDQNNKYMLLFGDGYIWVFKNGARVGTVEVTTPYLASEVKDIRFCTFARLMYLVHSSYPPKVLTHSSDTAWTLADVDLFDGPYLTQEKGKTLSLSGTSGTVTVTSSSAIFSPNDTSGAGGTGKMNRHVRVKDGSTWRWLKITGYTSPTVVTAAIQPDSLGVAGVFSATTNLPFRMGAWSSGLGFPRTITDYENRVTYGGSSSYPDRIWFSEIDDYVSHRPTFSDGTTGASLAVDVTLSYPEVSDINWMISRSKLLIGTTSAEHYIVLNSGSSGNSPEARAQTGEGSPFLPAVELADANIFFSDGGTKIKEFSYNFDQDSFLPSDLTLLADELTSAGISQATWQKSPWQTLWLGLKDGSLLSFTYSKSQEIYAFATHSLGGGGKVNALSCLRLGFNDKLYCVVDRVINGVTKSYVELMDDQFKGNKFDAVFLDSYVDYKSTLKSASLSVAGNTATASSSSFVAGDVGSLIEQRDSSGKLTACYKITGYTSSTVVTVSELTPPLSLPLAPDSWTVSLSSAVNPAHLLNADGICVKAGGGVVLKDINLGSGITIPSDIGRFSTIQVGFPYTQTQKSLKLIPAEQKLGLVRKDRAADFAVVIENSAGFDVAVNNGGFRPLSDRLPSDLMGEGQSLVSGLIGGQLTCGHSDYTQVLIKQDNPMPLTILSWGIMYESSTEATT